MLNILLSSHLVIQVENNYELSHVAVRAVPRFSIKRGLLQSFCFNFSVFCEDMGEIQSFLNFLLLQPFLFLEYTFGNGTIEWCLLES